MYILLRIGIFLTTVLFSINLVSQAESDTTEQGISLYIFELSGEIVDPISTFGDRLINKGIGLSGTALKQRAVDSPGFLGLHLSYHFYESQSVDYQDIFSGVSVNIRDRVSTHDISLGAIYRHYPDLVLGPIEFYAQAGLGLRWFYTVLSSTDVDIDESLDFRFLNNAWLITGGVGLGFHVDIKQSVLLNFGIHYQTGSTGSYYAKEDGLNGPDAIDYFRRNTSSLDQLIYKFGVSWLY